MKFQAARWSCSNLWFNNTNIYGLACIYVVPKTNIHLYCCCCRSMFSGLVEYPCGDIKMYVQLKHQYCIQTTQPDIMRYSAQLWQTIVVGQSWMWMLLWLVSSHSFAIIFTQFVFSISSEWSSWLPERTRETVHKYLCILC